MILAIDFIFISSKRIFYFNVDWGPLLCLQPWRQIDAYGVERIIVTSYVEQNKVRLVQAILQFLHDQSLAR